METNTDDWPFLVDSVSGELDARGLEVARLLHPVVGVERDGDGRIRRRPRPRDAAHRESVMHFDLARGSTTSELAEVEHAVRDDAGRRPQGRQRLRGDDRARSTT